MGQVASCFRGKSVSDASAQAFSVTDDATWLTLSPTSGTTPTAITMTAGPDRSGPQAPIPRR